MIAQHGNEDEINFFKIVHFFLTAKKKKMTRDKTSRSLMVKGWLLLM